MRPSTMTHVPSVAVSGRSAFEVFRKGGNQSWAELAMQSDVTEPTEFDLREYPLRRQCRTVTITRRALQFSSALLAKDKRSRVAAEGELMAALRLKSWEFINLPHQCPSMRYIDDVALRGQLERPLEQALYRPVALGE